MGCVVLINSGVFYVGIVLKSTGREGSEFFVPARTLIAVFLLRSHTLVTLISLCIFSYILISCSTCGNFGKCSCVLFLVFFLITFVLEISDQDCILHPCRSHPNFL